MCYNMHEVVTVHQDQYAEALQQVRRLTVGDQKRLLHELLRVLAIPLPNPPEFFDDWEDREVDDLYGHPR